MSSLYYSKNGPFGLVLSLGKKWSRASGRGCEPQPLQHEGTVPPHQADPTPPLASTDLLFSATQPNPVKASIPLNGVYCNVLCFAVGSQPTAEETKPVDDETRSPSSGGTDPSGSATFYDAEGGVGVHVEVTLDSSQLPRVK